MLAIIDIGSNSCRLMLSEGSKTISKEVHTTRLGDGLAFTGLIKEERMQTTCDMIVYYVDKAREQGASDVRIFATEAVRVATNRDIFIDMVRERTGITIHIVPSECEAKLGFSGAYTGHTPLAVVDIGGASTEIIVGDDRSIRYAKSVHIGCVRMRDKCGEDDALLDEYIDEMIAEYGEIPPVERAVFVAGTASTVATMMLEMDDYIVEKVDNVYVGIDEIRRLIRLMKDTPMDMRHTLVGLPEDRNDIMYGGLRLIEKILVRLDLDGFRFSDRDNLEGYAKYVNGEITL